MAISPAGKESRPLVGIIVDGVTGFGRAIMRGVMRHANLQRRWLIFEELRNVMRPKAWPAFDGAIVAGAGQNVIEYAFRRSRHVVMCSGSADPARSPVACMDDYAVGQVAAEHLLDCRLRRFAFFGHNTRSPLSSRRYEGFRDALAARGFACEDPGFGWPTAIEERYPANWPRILAWLRDLPKPVGVMSVDDVAAHRLASACLEAGVSVPDQVAIVGVNNDDLFCESAWPPLSSVEADYSRVGYAAAEMLETLLAGKKLAAADRVVRLAPLGVARRQSTELLAVDDPALAEAVRFIRHHACDPCNVADVLRHVPVGRRWLERQFTAKLGRSPHDEIMHVRVETAKRLLL
ncbi:MAG TPA: substrate-binding domain-containing protein, partial [Tepidisphaeraceae bacterium]